MPKKKGRQHYVPQFYFKRFRMSGTRKQVLVLDKRQPPSANIRPTSTANLAAEFGFFAVVGAGAADDWLTGREKLWADAIRDAVDAANARAFRRCELAEFVAAQLTRTEEARRRIIDMPRQMYALLTGTDEPITLEQIEHTMPGAWQAVHSQIILQDL